MAVSLLTGFIDDGIDADMDEFASAADLPNAPTGERDRYRRCLSQ